MGKSTDIAVITKGDLALVENNLLNIKQAQLLLSPTPAQYVKKRPAKGGGTWDFVSGGYVKKQLNLMFGWDWDFEIINEILEPSARQAIVKGRLTCRVGDRTIVKMQYGRSDIKYKTAKDEKGNKVTTDEPLDLGNDLKAAATDCLKKCASEIGIAADIYNKEDFQETMVIDDPDAMLKEIMDLWADHDFKMAPESIARVNHIIDTREFASYPKVLKHLKSTILKREPAQ